MNTLFHLSAEYIQDEPPVLLVETGPDHFCYAILSKDRKAVSELKYISLEENEDFSSLLPSGYGGREFASVIAGVSYPHAMLVPDRFPPDTDRSFDMLYGEGGGSRLRDEVNEWHLNTCYSIPANMQQPLKRKYPGIYFIHAYSAHLRVYNGFPVDDQISLHFNTRTFLVIVRKDGNLQLAQLYWYETPMDITYYLLKICYEFRLNQSRINLIISGLVEKESAVYKELSGYFLQINFRKSGLVLPENEYPSHYFIAFDNLAACAS